MKLIIAEKPSVAQTIAAALGVKKRRDGYLEGDDMLISWCFGHLAGLADASIYDAKYSAWNMEDLPIIPAGMRWHLAFDSSGASFGPGQERELEQVQEYALGPRTSAVLVAR